MTLFSKTVKYIHKVVSGSKKSLKFNGLSNAHIFKFAFGCLFSHHTASRTKCILGQPNFQNFPGRACPRIPLEPRSSGARLIRLLVGSHPPAKTRAYGRACSVSFFHPSRSFQGGKQKTGILWYVLHNLNSS